MASARRVFSVALTPLALGAAVLGFRGLDFAGVGQLLSHVGLLALLGLAPQGFGLAIETWGWRHVLFQVGHQVAYVPLLGVRTATEALGQMLPGGALLGESIKPALLARSLALPVPVGIGATVYRKYLRLLAHGFYVVLAFLFGGPAVERLSFAWLGERGLSLSLLAVGVGLVLAAVGLQFVAGQGRLAARLLVVLRRVRWSSLSHFLRRRRAAFGATDRASRAFFGLPPASIAAPIVGCTLAWLAEGVESWILLRLVGVELPLTWVVALDVVISLGRQVLFVIPAGVGLQEAGYLAVLSGLGVSDPLTTSAAFSLLKRAKEIFWALVGLGWLGHLWKQSSERSWNQDVALPCAARHLA